MELEEVGLLTPTPGPERPRPNRRVSYGVRVTRSSSAFWTFVGLWTTIPQQNERSHSEQWFVVVSE